MVAIMGSGRSAAMAAIEKTATSPSKMPIRDGVGFQSAGRPPVRAPAMEPTPKATSRAGTMPSLSPVTVVRQRREEGEEREEPHAGEHEHGVAQDHVTMDEGAELARQWGLPGLSLFGRGNEQGDERGDGKSGEAERGESSCASRRRCR